MSVRRKTRWFPGVRTAEILPALSHVRTVGMVTLNREATSAIRMYSDVEYELVFAMAETYGYALVPVNLIWPRVVIFDTY